MEMSIRSLIFSLLLPVMFFSCTGNIDDNESVPDGVLRIFVDGNTSIKADGKETVTFRVMYGSMDVSTSADMNLIRTFDGDESRLKAGVNEFSTLTPGSYIFTARYFSGTAVYTDNSVEITVLPAEESHTSEWKHKILGIQFTSTTCTGCPSLSSAIRQIQSESPGLLYPVSFHLNYIGADPMAIAASTTYADNLIGDELILPAFFYNFHQASDGMMMNNISVIRNELEAEIEKYDPSCGVAVCTDYDHTEKNLTVTVSVKSNIQQRCRLVIFLVEDGIVAEQTGDRDYVHNNVVRSVLTSGVYGDYFNDRLPLYPGMEYSISKSAVLDKGWNDGNMRVVAAVLVPTEDGASFRGDNVNACDLAGGKADYETSE